jgi:hypothetical protein
VATTASGTATRLATTVGEEATTATTTWSTTVGELQAATTVGEAATTEAATTAK